jgi:tetratricopeptide (TPR) repeat protein
MEAPSINQTTDFPESLRRSEMLGNQYFMARKYAEAGEILENITKNNPRNKPARCKLVICYIQTGNIPKALDQFLPLIKEDTDIITKMDPVQDDCPCLDLVAELEENVDTNHRSLDFLLTLGMLSLYCDIEKSIKYFSLAQKLDENNFIIRDILSHLYIYLKRTNR